ncbi:unnamed protein product [Effrenium voratum]|nr:unnamed protein product [Effrenium voratum]
MAMQCAFEQVGGRRRLVSEDDFTSCLQNDVSAVPSGDRMRSLRREWKQHQRSLRERAKLLEFLKKHHFDDLDAPKFTCLGFRYTFPLLQAARAQEASMVLLLVRFGADVTQTDRWGYTAVDYLKCQATRRKVQRLYLQVRPRASCGAKPEAEMRLSSEQCR